jgi:hypothetical protein
MRVAKLRGSSELKSRRAKRVLRRRSSTPMVCGEHFEMRIQFLIEVAVEASWAKERSNSGGNFPEQREHGLAPSP